MAARDPLAGQRRSAPFDRFTNLQRLHPDRSGHLSGRQVRHHLYAGRANDTHANALIKLATRPGLVYQHDLANEIAALSSINRELPDSRYFPLLWDHGRLPDGRTFVIMSLFDEWPLSTTIGPERIPERLVAHIRTSLEIATALAEIHRIQLFHLDLNPMNILYRSEGGRPVIKIVDFESSYQAAGRSSGAVHNPPTTPGFSAPEVHQRAPDGRADVFSLGAVLYTMIAGYEWSPPAELSNRIRADAEIDDDLKMILLTAVERDPDKRYPSIQDMQAALAAYLESIWPGRR